MRKLTLLAVIMLMAVLVGCSDKNESDNNKGNEQEVEKVVSLDEIVTEIKEQIAEDLKADGVEDALVDGQLSMYDEVDLMASEEENPFAAIIAERMELDIEKIAKGSALIPMMNTKSDEFIVLEAKDEADLASLKEALEKELANQVQTWEQYLPDQFEKVKDNVIKTNGKYLLYVTYDTPDDIVAIFDSKFK